MVVCYGFYKGSENPDSSRSMFFYFIYKKIDDESVPQHNVGGPLQGDSCRSIINII